MTSPGSAFYEPWRYLPTHASGQLAVAGYLWDGEKGTYGATGLDVLTLRESSITHITAFATPEVFRHFGLPDALPS